MSKTKHQYLRGTELLEALLRSNAAQVKWIVAGMEPHQIPKHQAYYIARTSPYEGKYRNGRVYFIREIDDRPPPVTDMQFWDGRAVTHYNKPVDKETVKVWERYFASHPTP